MSIKKKSRTDREKASSRKRAAVGIKNAVKRKFKKAPTTGHGVVLKAAPVTSAKVIVKDLGISKSVLGAARRALIVDL